VNEMLAFRLLFPIGITVLFGSMTWIFMRAISPALSRFQKLLLYYGCTIVFGNGCIAMLGKWVTELTGSEDLPIFMMIGWIILIGWMAWRKHLS